MTANDIEESHREAAYFPVFQFWILDTFSSDLTAVCLLSADNVKKLDGAQGSTHTHTHTFHHNTH